MGMRRHLVNVEVRSVLTVVANTTMYTWGGHLKALGAGRCQECPDCRGQHCHVYLGDIPGYTLIT